MAAGPAPSTRLPRAIAVRLPDLRSDWVFAGLLAVVLVWIAIKANGGLRVGATTTVAVVVDLAAGLTAAVGVLVAQGTRRHLPGTIAAGTFALFVIATAISTVWSVAPDQSWNEANRTISYLAAFGAGMILVRLAPHRWAALLGGITLACVAVSAWALTHKVFPAWLEPEAVYARLREPFGYWNAVGAVAAMGVPGCLWLGARRNGHAAVNALAYPATGLLFVVMMLSYSRGALFALVVGCLFWFAAVPLRLRAAPVLAAGILGGGLVIAWVFSQVALSEDLAPLDLRDEAGHQLGIAVAFVLLALLAAGLAIGFLRDRLSSPTPRRRRQVGIAVLAALALVPLAGVAALTASERGLTGSISHGWTQLTDPNATQPSNEPGRLTAVGSVRARYWNDGLKIFGDRPWLGAGVGGYQLARLRHRTDTLDVLHAHGYLIQVLADRGIVGLSLSLAALIALFVAIAYATGLRRGGRALRTTPERVGLITLTAMIVVFGVHSFVDWTWFVPGIAMPMLLAGGWLAGRGAYELPPRPTGRLSVRVREGLRSRPRTFAAAAAVILAASASWAALQPQRSLEATDDALEALNATPPQLGTARNHARDAAQINPLAVDPLFAQAAIEIKARNLPGAQRALEQAVQLQPANPSTWTALADFQLHDLEDPAKAKDSVGAALYLDPRSVQAVQLLIEINRTATATS